MQKLEVLRNLLQQMPGAVVAYSGGVDSTFLAAVAHQVLGERLLTVTADSPTYPDDQLTEATDMARRFGWRHQVIATTEFAEPNFTTNPENRCYYCKYALYQQLLRLARAEGTGVTVLDGANIDDNQDHRPGHQAARELGVRSPLQEAGLTKEEIRILSREMNLPTWDKPAYACLASRVPYGREITPKILSRIDRSEQFLKTLGFRQFRVRDHYPIARIEIEREQLEQAWRQRELIAKRLHEYGFLYVTLDLDGFRSGSMNAGIAKAENKDG